MSGEVNLCAFHKNAFVETNLSRVNPNMSPEGSLGDPSVNKSFGDVMCVWSVVQSHGEHRSRHGSAGEPRTGLCM